MQFNEELLTDEPFREYHEYRQSELIAKYCSDIDVRIRSASSRQEARGLAESACRKFEQACASALVRNALAKYIEELITRYWENSNS